MIRHVHPRAKAFLVHLLISVSIAALAVALVYFIWYHGAIADLQGVDRLVLIIIGVDMTLGPLMTLIVFSPKKPRRLIVLDLGIIAALQIAALIYGLSTVYMARPAYIVFAIDRFNLVSVRDIDAASQARALEQGLPGMPLGRPRLVSARLPEDPQKKTEILFASLEGGADLHQRPEWFVPYALDRDRALQKSRPMESLRQRNPLSETAWQSKLNRFASSPDQLRWLPVQGNEREGVAILSAADGRFQGMLDLYPVWD